MDRQEKIKLKDGSENGSENGSNEDSDADDKVSTRTLHLCVKVCHGIRFFSSHIIHSWVMQRNLVDFFIHYDEMLLWLLSVGQSFHQYL